MAGSGHTFEWDDANRGHLARHRVTPEEFEEGMANDPVELGSAEIHGEIRTKVAAMTVRGRILEMVYTVRRGRIRAVTAHPVHKKRREHYRGYFDE